MQIIIFVALSYTAISANFVKDSFIENFQIQMVHYLPCMLANRKFQKEMRDGEAIKPMSDSSFTCAATNVQTLIMDTCVKMITGRLYR